MLYCDSKNPARKTKASYEQSLKIFSAYLRNYHNITEPAAIKTAHIRSYIQYLRDRGKYTVVADEYFKNKNNPDGRTDRAKPVSDTTIANYLRNIKVFLNFLVEERELKENPASKVPNIKAQRKQKRLMVSNEIKRQLQTFDLTTFHGVSKLANDPSNA
jgi:integrase/recombinase XerD